MKKNSWLIFVLVGSLAGCVIGSRPELVTKSCSPEQVCSKVFSDPEIGYSVSIPENLSRWTRYSPSMDSPLNYPTFTTPDDNDFVRVTILPLRNSECSNVLMGVSKIQKLSATIDSSVWGQFDYLDTIIHDPNTQPLCYLSSTSPALADHPTYVLCSKKDDKNVFICISQATKNEQLVKQVFESFQWTK